MAKPPLPRFPGDGVLRGSLFAIYDLGITRRPGAALRRLTQEAAQPFHGEHDELACQPFQPGDVVA